MKSTCKGIFIKSHIKMDLNNQNSRINERVVITGVGMVTPVGHDSIMAPASINAGISRFNEIPDFVTKKGAASVGSFAYGITDDRSGSDRLLSMAIPAAQEALFMAEEFYDDLNIPEGVLFLSLSPKERPTYEEFDQDDTRDLLELAEIEAISSVEIIKEGHSGGVIALSKSIFLLRQKKAKVCIVGGVDSLVEYPTLAWLEENRRLKTDDRPYGFIPGESAAFLVLELESTAMQRGAPILAQIINTGYAIEEANMFSDKPLYGLGLPESINTTLINSNLSSDQINGMICDLNGEYYRMKEWSLAQSRIFDGSTPVPQLWHPAEYIGDVGASSVIVFTALAVAGINNDYFCGEKLLVWSSSDMGGRGSVILTSYSGNGAGPS